MSDDDVAQDVTPLEFLRAVYCNEGVPLPTRMKAAIECLQYVHPKLAVTVDASRNFADRMDEIARLRGRSNVIDSTSNGNVINAKSPRPLPFETDPAEG